MTSSASQEREKLPLSKATEYLLEESRMVLPGLQALFGFQLIAVFNSSFSEKLGAFEQRLHLVAIALVVVAIAMIMTPAAYHRQTSPRAVSAHWVMVSTRLLLVSMVPLAVAICIDFYIVAWLVTGRVIAAVGASLLLAVFGFFWFVLPRVQRLRQLREEPHAVP